MFHVMFSLFSHKNVSILRTEKRKIYILVIAMIQKPEEKEGIKELLFDDRGKQEATGIFHSVGRQINYQFFFLFYFFY